MLGEAIFIVSCVTVACIAAAAGVCAVFQHFASERKLKESSETIPLFTSQRNVYKDLFPQQASNGRAPHIDDRDLPFASLYSILEEYSYDAYAYITVILVGVAILLNTLVLYYDRGSVVRSDGITGTYAPWIEWTFVSFIVYAYALRSHGISNWMRTGLPALIGALTFVFITLGTITSATFQWAFLAFALAAHLIVLGYFIAIARSQAVVRLWGADFLLREPDPMQSHEDPRVRSSVLLFITWVIGLAKVVVVIPSPEFSDAITDPMNSLLGQVIIDLAAYLIFAIVIYFISRSWTRLAAKLDVFRKNNKTQ